MNKPAIDDSSPERLVVSLAEYVKWESKHVDELTNFQFYSRLILSKIWDIFLVSTTLVETFFDSWLLYLFYDLTNNGYFISSLIFIIISHIGISFIFSFIHYQDDHTCCWTTLIAIALIPVSPFLPMYVTLILVPFDKAETAEVKKLVFKNIRNWLDGQIQHLLLVWQCFGQTFPLLIIKMIALMKFYENDKEPLDINILLLSFFISLFNFIIRLPVQFACSGWGGMQNHYYIIVKSLCCALDFIIIFLTILFLFDAGYQSCDDNDCKLSQKIFFEAWKYMNFGMAPVFVLGGLGFLFHSLSDADSSIGSKIYLIFFVLIAGIFISISMEIFTFMLIYYVFSKLFPIRWPQDEKPQSRFYELNTWVRNSNYVLSDSGVDDHLVRLCCINYCLNYGGKYFSSYYDPTIGNYLKQVEQNSFKDANYHSLLQNRLTKTKVKIQVYLHYLRYAVYDISDNALVLFFCRFVLVLALCCILIKLLWMLFLPSIIIYNFIVLSWNDFNYLQLGLYLFFFIVYLLSLLYLLIILPYESRYMKYICPHCDPLRHFNEWEYLQLIVDYIKYYYYPWITLTPLRRDIIFEKYGKEIGGIIAEYTGYGDIIGIDVNSFLDVCSETHLGAREVLVIVTGPQRSGKSTLIRAIQLQAEQFGGQAGVEVFYNKIYLQLIETMIELISKCDRDRLNADIAQDNELKQSVMIMENLVNINKAGMLKDLEWTGDEPIPWPRVDWYEHLKRLFSNEHIRNVYNNLKQFGANIPETSKFYLNDFERVFNKDYVVETHDVLRIDRRSYQPFKASVNVDECAMKFVEGFNLIPDERRELYSKMANEGGISVLVFVASFRDLYKEEEIINTLELLSNEITSRKDDINGVIMVFTGYDIFTQRYETGTDTDDIQAAANQLCERFEQTATTVAGDNDMNFTIKSVHYNTTNLFTNEDIARSIQFEVDMIRGL